VKQFDRFLQSTVDVVFGLKNSIRGWGGLRQWRILAELRKKEALWRPVVEITGWCLLSPEDFGDELVFIWDSVHYWFLLEMNKSRLCLEWHL